MQCHVFSNETIGGKENKRPLQTLSIDNVWSNKIFLYYLTFRMRQHTSSEVTVTTVTRRTGDKLKNNDKVDTTDS